MKSDQPKISIIMPSFNQRAFLEKAICSVLNQNYPNKELIIIDGGSTDGSVEIIKKYQSDLAYWVSEPDRGQTHALNKAVAQVKGEIIGWLNSDDHYLPNAFRRAAQAFQRNPDVILVHGDRIMIDRDGHVMGWTALPAFDPARTGYVICSDAAFWRAKSCRSLTFNESLHAAMDIDFFSRLYHLGPFLKVDQPLGAFRCYAENKTSVFEQLAQEEYRRQWQENFSQFPDGWKNSLKITPGRALLPFLLHPFVIALPFLYRRFILGRRGITALF